MRTIVNPLLRLNARERFALLAAVLSILGGAAMLAVVLPMVVAEIGLAATIAIAPLSAVAEWALLGISAQRRGVYLGRRDHWRQPHRAFTAYVASLLPAR